MAFVEHMYSTGSMPLATETTVIRHVEVLSHNTCNKFKTVTIGQQHSSNADKIHNQNLRSYNIDKEGTLRMKVTQE